MKAMNKYGGAPKRARNNSNNSNNTNDVNKLIKEIKDVEFEDIIMGTNYTISEYLKEDEDNFIIRTKTPSGNYVYTGDSISYINERDLIKHYPSGFNVESQYLQNNLYKIHKEGKRSVEKTTADNNQTYWNPQHKTLELRNEYHDHGEYYKESYPTEEEQKENEVKEDILVPLKKIEYDEFYECNEDDDLDFRKVYIRTTAYTQMIIKPEWLYGKRKFNKFQDNNIGYRIFNIIDTGRTIDNIASKQGFIFGGSDIGGAHCQFDEKKLFKLEPLLNHEINSNGYRTRKRPRPIPVYDRRIALGANMGIRSGPVARTAISGRSEEETRQMQEYDSQYQTENQTGSQNENQTENNNSNSNNGYNSDYYRNRDPSDASALPPFLRRPNR